jgi:2-polyprenyl-3-methyl-5-hydroxy-6-metoxy-1,4-benzoquinol methylase
MINHRDYIAVDPNRNKMEYMKAKNLSKCLFIHGTLDTVTFTEDSYFDTVLFIEVIEHLVDMDEARFNLMKIHKLLKPNGKLVVATPNFGGFMGRAMDNLYGIFQKGAYKEEHRLKFDLPSLKQLCQECGFRYVKSKIPSGADMVCLFQKS